MVSVRFFFVERKKCPKCDVDRGLVAFQGIAEALAEKFGGECLSFEAYNALNAKKFPFLEGLGAPVLVVGEEVVSSGKIPVQTEVEEAIKKALI